VAWTTALVGKLGLTFLHKPIGAYCHDEGNRGVTVVAILNTSHLALHIWDEVMPALLQLDIYSCKNLDLSVILTELNLLSVIKVERKLFDRSITIREVTRRSERI
jgi:S-adenosylmethionine/arginine decarboxylase-like enzyme